jgi:hypothetical protein
VNNISGESGKIIELHGRDYYTSSSGKKMQYTGKAKVRLDSGRIIDIPIAMLGVNERFMRMSADEMELEMKKPFHGRKIGEIVYISREEPYYD